MVFLVIHGLVETISIWKGLPPAVATNLGQVLQFEGGVCTGDRDESRGILGIKLCCWGTVGVFSIGDFLPGASGTRRQSDLLGNLGGRLFIQGARITNRSLCLSSHIRDILLTGN